MALPPPFRIGNAWSGGAARWEVRKRGAFANDPLNLLPADASANRAKGDGDAAIWLPPNKGFRCGYVARQVAVKAKYGLPLTPAEHDAIARVLGTCPGQKLPTDSGAPVLAPVRVVIPDRAPPTSDPARTSHPPSAKEPAACTTGTATPRGPRTPHRCTAATPATGPTWTATGAACE